MTDWIHCNSCYIQPSPSNKFFLTSCGHVFCVDCSEKATKPACYVCQNKCNIIPLSSKMDSSVEMYFRNPADIVKKHGQELIKVVEFQSAHRKRLLTKTKDKLEKAKVLYNDFKKATSYIQDLERKNKTLVQEMAYLKQHLASIKGNVGREQQTRSAVSTQQNRTTNLSAKPTSNQTQARSPFTNMTLLPSNSYPPPPPTGNRLIARTPPSGGRMGVMPGSTPATPMSQGYFTPRGQETVNGIFTPSPQDQLTWLTNDLQSISLPNRNQSKFSQLPSSSRSLNGSGGSSSQGNVKKATVSPYSQHNTPT